ncbi:ATP-binding protein [Rhodovulum sp. DZ06]|uniref:ATP-binding protein n=1 Tax=Rhodovulum sp. DZ06 TaxID=3425126 RepID=UPI003D32824A
MRLLSAAFGLLAAALAANTILAAALGRDAGRLHPDWPGMALSTAAAATALGLGVFLVGIERGGRAARRGRLLGRIAAAFAGLKLLEYAVAAALGDAAPRVLLMWQQGDVMSPATATAALCAGLALSGLGRPGCGATGLAFTAATLVIGISALFGYWFAPGGLLAITPYAALSLPTAAACTLIGAALLVSPLQPLSRRFALSAAPVAAMARRLSLLVAISVAAGFAALFTGTPDELVVRAVNAGLIAVAAVMVCAAWYAHAGHAAALGVLRAERRASRLQAEAQAQEMARAERERRILEDRHAALRRVVSRVSMVTGESLEVIRSQFEAMGAPGGDVAPLPGAAAGWRVRVAAALRRADHLVARLQTAGHASGGVATRTNVDAELAQRIAYLRSLLPAGVTASYACKTSHPFAICDREALVEAFEELVQNAGEAMPDGGRVVIELLDSPAADPPRRAGWDWLEIRVSDGGGPGDGVETERFKEPFYTTKGRPEAGLGLSVVEDFCRGCGGRFEIERRPEGVVARMRLPGARKREDGAAARR